LAPAAAARCSTWTTQRYREWKRALVVESLAQAGSMSRSTI
jgi:hypothetical protein